jgi:DNA topoisomerase-1
VDLAMAVKLLSLPREVGAHPEDGKMITANFGRFGPYLAHDGKYASLETPEDVFNVGVNHAVTILAEKKAKGGRRGPEVLKELGAGADGVAIKVLKGRYGPYVSDGETNATIFEGNDPLTLTLEQAQALIAERIAKGGGKKKKKRAAPKAKAKAPAKAKAKPKPEAAEKPEKKAKSPAKKKAVAKKKAAPQKTDPKKKPEPVAGE